MDTTIDAAGRVVIPKALRERTGLRGGTKLRIEYEDGRIVIEPANDPVRLVRRGSVLVATREGTAGQLTNEEVLEQIRALRESRR